MNRDRIKNLEEWIKEDPHEPFNKYALALEYSQSLPEQASLLFGELLTLHSDYLPTYYIAANFYAELGKREKAIQILKSGIILAQKQDNSKTLRELKTILEQMEFEG